jgi:hypothetical protein
MLKMLVLDTDHLVELDRGSAAGALCSGNLKMRETRSQPRLSQRKNNSVGGWRRSIGNVIRTNKLRRINVSNGVLRFSLRGMCCRGTQRPQTSCKRSVGNVFETDNAPCSDLP